MSEMFVCQSLPLAAWLHLRGHNYEIDLDPNDSSRAVFLFQRDTDGQLDRDVLDFQTDSASVAPRRFKGVEIKLRDEMYALLRRKGGRQND